MAIPPGLTLKIGQFHLPNLRHYLIHQYLGWKSLQGTFQTSARHSMTKYPHRVSFKFNILNSLALSQVSQTGCSHDGLSTLSSAQPPCKNHCLGVFFPHFLPHFFYISTVPRSPSGSPGCTVLDSRQRCSFAQLWLRRIWCLSRLRKRTRHEMVDNGFPSALMTRTTLCSHHSLSHPSPKNHKSNPKDAKPCFSLSPVHR